MKRTAPRFFFLLAFVLSAALPASAHEMFLKPQAYRLAPDTHATAELVNGTFDQSENVISRDRMRDVTVHGGGETLSPSEAQWSESGLSAFLAYETGGEGTYAIGVSTKPRMITLSRKAFSDYLKHEGVSDTLADFEKNSTLDQVRERYSKHVRTIVQVGDARSEDHRIEFGYPVEIILENNPYTAHVGDRVGFRVFSGGEPLTDQLVYASHDGFHRHAEDGAHQRAQTLRTDDDGRGFFDLTAKGVWYLTLIHMKKLDNDSNADYESNWATVTFKVD